jgi:hypothetical protein
MWDLGYDSGHSLEALGPDDRRVINQQRLSSPGSTENSLCDMVSDAEIYVRTAVLFPWAEKQVTVGQKTFFFFNQFWL